VDAKTIRRQGRSTTGVLETTVSIWLTIQRKTATKIVQQRLIDINKLAMEAQRSRAAIGDFLFEVERHHIFQYQATIFHDLAALRLARQA
jgi:hypothetical protein